MGISIFSIVLAIIALPIYFLFSITVAEWLVWVFYAAITLILFIKSFTEYNSFLKGGSKSTGDIIGIAAYPFVTSIMGIILLVLLFIDINKLHVLWLYPIIALIFEFTIGKRAVDVIAPDVFKEIEKRQKED